MGANSTRATQVLVSNAAVINTGTTAATAVNNDVLLLNRVGVAVGAGTTISDINNDVVRVALGTSATAGVVDWSAPIHVRSIRKITKQLYEIPVQHVVTISAASVPATSAAGTTFSIKINFHDTNRIMSQNETAQYFTYTTLVANETSTVVYDALRTKINAVATAANQIVASGTTTLILTGRAVTDNALGFPQFRYFDVALRKGFTYTAGASVVATAGKPGRGTGLQVRQMELAGKYGFNRTQFPVDTDTRRGSTTGYYNLVTIEFGTPHLSVHHSTYVAPQTVVVAFAAAETTADTLFDGAGTPIISTKQQAFLDSLEALAESAGVHVE